MLHSETKGGTGLGLFDGISGNILCSHKTSLYLEVHQTEYRRANARNITFRNSLRLPIYIINSVDEKKMILWCQSPSPYSNSTAPQFFFGNLLFIFSQSFLISFFVCLFVSYLCRKDKGNSTAEYRRIPLSELNVQLTGSGSGRRKRATDFSWTLSDLDEYTLYSIRILMYTTGDSEYSIPLEIRTAEAGSSWVVTGILGMESHWLIQGEGGGSDPLP